MSDHKSIAQINCEFTYSNDGNGMFSVEKQRYYITNIISLFINADHAPPHQYYTNESATLGPPCCRIITRATDHFSRLRFAAQ